MKEYNVRIEFESILAEDPVAAAREAHNEVIAPNSLATALLVTDVETGETVQVDVADHPRSVQAILDKAELDCAAVSVAHERADNYLMGLPLTTEEYVQLFIDEAEIQLANVLSERQRENPDQEFILGALSNAACLLNNAALLIQANTNPQG